MHCLPAKVMFVNRKCVICKNKDTLVLCIQYRCVYCTKCNRWIFNRCLYMYVSFKSPCSCKLTRHSLLFIWWSFFSLIYIDIKQIATYTTPHCCFHVLFYVPEKNPVFSSMIMKGYIIFLFENKDMIEQLQNSYAPFLLTKNKQMHYM